MDIALYLKKGAFVKESGMGNMTKIYFRLSNKSNPSHTKRTRKVDDWRVIDWRLTQ